MLFRSPDDYHLKYWVKNWPTLKENLLKEKIDDTALIKETPNGLVWNIKGLKYVAGLWLSKGIDWKAGKRPKPEYMAEIMRKTFNYTFSHTSLTNYSAPSKSEVAYKFHHF